MSETVISCVCHNNGAIEQLFIHGKPFNIFAGKITTSNGITAAATWSEVQGALRCSLAITRISGDSKEGAEVRFRIPYMFRQSQMNVWCARKGFPKSLVELGGTDLFYGDTCYGTVLPVVTFMNPTDNTGLTIGRKPIRYGGTLSFYFGTYHEEGMDIRISRLSVLPGKTVEQEFFFFGHENCWRPGLKLYADMFAEYFDAPLNQINQWGGAFAITNPFTKLDYTRQPKPDWVEIHNHFPHYGEYAPIEKEWLSVIPHDYPRLSEAHDYHVSRELINQHIEKLHELGIRAMLYIQINGDGFIPWAKKYFPESIAREASGTYMQTWKNCCFMNGDPDTPFGKHISRMIERFDQYYQDIDGVFLDQLCYQTMDYAHSDGRSAGSGQYLYEYGASYDKNLEKLAQLMHSKDKAILANGAFDLSVSKFADAIMAEGCSGISDTLKYLCIRKPLLVHTYTEDVSQVETGLRNCLLCGAGWSLGGSSSLAEIPEWNDDVRATFEAYLPLVKAVFGKKILLKANPVKIRPAVPDVRWEIFSDEEEKELYIALIATASRLYHPVEIVLNFHFEAKVSIMQLGKDHFTPLNIRASEPVLLPDQFIACILKYSMG